MMVRVRVRVRVRVVVVVVLGVLGSGYLVSGIGCRNNIHPETTTGADCRRRKSKRRRGGRESP